MERGELAAAVEREALEATLAAKVDELEAAAHEHGPGGLSSVRQADHAGHRIVVRTTYEVTIDGEPFDVHMNVDNAGRVQYHGLPTRDFASVIDLVAKVIDQFPGEFGPGPTGPAPTGGSGKRPGPTGPEHHDHDHGHGGDSGPAGAGGSGQRLGPAGPEHHDHDHDHGHHGGSGGGG